MKIPLLKNTITTYINMVVSLLRGILVTRWMIEKLGETNYGLWTMLWSFFCCSLLLDFGLGVAAQKATAVELYKKDSHKYNLIISSVFFFHVAMTILIMLGTIIAAFYTHELFNLPPEQDVTYYRICFLIFGLGSAALFPFGVFTDILTGCQQIWLCNRVFVISSVIELVGTATVLLSGGELIALVIFIMLLQVFTKGLLTYYACKSVPSLRLILTFNKQIYKEIFNFSGMVYITSMCRMVWERGPVFFISAFCGSGASGGLIPVSIYQVGVKLTVQMSWLAGAYQKNVSPLTARLHSHKRYNALASILVNSMRWNSFLATGMAFGILLCAPQLIRWLFHYTDNINQAVYICRITALSVWFWLVFNNIPEEYLLMAEKHKFLAGAYIIEAVLFVVSTVAILRFNASVEVVMWTSIISRLIPAAFMMLPVTIKQGRINVRRLIIQAVIRPFIAIIPAAIVGTAMYPWMVAHTNDLVVIIACGCTSAIIYIPTAYFIVFTAEERRRMWRYIVNILPASAK